MVDVEGVVADSSALAPEPGPESLGPRPPTSPLVERSPIGNPGKPVAGVVGVDMPHDVHGVEARRGSERSQESVQAGKLGAEGVGLWIVVVDAVAVEKSSAAEREFPDLSTRVAGRPAREREPAVFVESHRHVMTGDVAVLVPQQGDGAVAIGVGGPGREWIDLSSLDVMRGLDARARIVPGERISLMAFDLDQMC